jgi:hypothetical protein
VTRHFSCVSRDATFDSNGKVCFSNSNAGTTVESEAKPKEVNYGAAAINCGLFTDCYLACVGGVPSAMILLPSHLYVTTVSGERESTPK